MISVMMRENNGHMEPMVLISAVLDGGSQIRRLNSWVHLEEIARDNHYKSRDIIFEEGTIQHLTELWGVAPN